MIHNDSFHSPQSTVLPCAMWLRLKAQHLKVDLIKSTKPELRFNIQWLQHQLIQQGELQQPLNLKQKQHLHVCRKGLWY